MRVGYLLIVCLFMVGCATHPTTSVQNGSSAATKNQTAAALNVELGATYIASKEYRLADAKLRKAMQQDPRSSAARWTYALLQERLEQVEAAEKYYREAITINPNDSRGQNNFGTFLCKQGRYKESDKHFQKALSDPLYKFRAAANLNAGVCAMETPDYDLAKDYFEEVLRLRPSNRVALYQMAKLHYLQNDFAGAQSYIRDFENVSQHTAESLWLAYRAERELGNVRSARSYAELLTNNFPKSNEAAQLARVN